MARRMGGRSARRALREAPLKEEDKAVQPGLAGQCFRPLSEADVQRIHQAALDVLEHIGLSQAIDSCASRVPSGPDMNTGSTTETPTSSALEKRARSIAARIAARPDAVRRAGTTMRL